MGAAFDYVQNLGGGLNDSSDNYSTHNDVYVVGLYGTYKVTDKLSLNARGEYMHGENIHAYTGPGSYSQSFGSDAYELTGTVEYDLWANVISRVEIRWDHLAEGTSSIGRGNSNMNRSALGLYANVIYKF